MPGNFAYIVTGEAVVKLGTNNNNNTVQLIRLKLPCNSCVNEWNGAWSVNSGEWTEVSDEVKLELGVTYQENSECWMSVSDFSQHFEEIHVCHLIPDADDEDIAMNLEAMFVVQGQWNGDAAAGGRDISHRFRNPKFLFTIRPLPGGLDGIPVVIQLFQDRVVGKGSTPLFIRADLYRLEKKKHLDKNELLVFEELTNSTNFAGDQSVSYR